MDIFIRNLPDQMTEKDVSRLLRPYFERVGISTWKCDKLKSKGCAIMTVVDIPKAQRFLQLHGQVQQTSAPKARVRNPIFHLNRLLFCSLSNKPIDTFLVKSLEKEDKEKKLKALVPRSANPETVEKHVIRTFEISQLRCGQWDYYNNDLVFRDYYHLDLSGQVSFAPGGLFVTMASNEPFELGSQLEIPYRTIDSYTTGSLKDPSLTFSLKEPPKIFRKIKSDEVSAKSLVRATRLSCSTIIVLGSCMGFMLIFGYLTGHWRSSS